MAFAYRFLSHRLVCAVSMMNGLAENGVIEVRALWRATHNLSCKVHRKVIRRRAFHSTPLPHLPYRAALTHERVRRTPQVVQNFLSSELRFGVIDFAWVSVCAQALRRRALVCARRR